MFWNLCPFHYGSQCVTLRKNGQPAVLTHIDAFGVYNVDVVDKNDTDNGVKASFVVAANKRKGGNINRLVATTGNFDEHINLEWNEGQQHPRLKYAQDPGEHGPEEQTFKVVFRKCA